MASKDQTCDSILLARVCQLIEWLKDVAKGRGDVHPPDLPRDNPLDEKHSLIFSYARKSTLKVRDAIKELQKQQIPDPRRMQVAIQQQDQYQIQDRQQQSKESSDQESTVNRSRSSDNKNVDKLKEEIDNLQEQLREQHIEFQKTKKALSEEIHSLKTEKDNLMARMSIMAGDKLTHNNPGIADLIDPNRPQKLAEKFGELYDDEWTDAIEKLNPRHIPEVERESIVVLASILKFCYAGSERIADIQLSYIEAACFSLKPPDREKKVNPKDVSEPARRHLLGAQYSASTVNMKTAVEMVTADLKRQKGLKETTQKIPKFTDKCIEICWSMVTHTPRMIYLWPDSKDRKIDRDMFQFYTKSGDTLDFVVWPAMLSYRDGPLLRKGTVQPVPVFK